MVKAVIFDLDGLLIDSEPLWQDAEMEVFAGVGLNITRKQCEETMGFRIDEAVAYWHNKFPWKITTQPEVVEKVLTRLNALILERGKPLPGVVQTLEFFKQKGIPMVVASSSHKHIIEHSLAAMKVREYFQDIFSAQYEEYGKPHPAIFLTAAKALSIKPEDCLVFEDSFYGMIAAKAAKMKLVAVPEAMNYTLPKYGFADVKLKTLEDWNEEVFQSLN